MRMMCYNLVEESGSMSIKKKIIIFILTIISLISISILIKSNIDASQTAEFSSLQTYAIVMAAGGVMGGSIFIIIYLINNK